MPQPLINFRDAVNPAGLDPTTRYAVFYIDGRFANEAAVRARCPHAKLYAITVRGMTGHGIFACDCEAGDMSVTQTVAWVDEQVRLGVDPIAPYASRDTWESQGLLSALAHYGERIHRWDADWDGDPHSMPAWADAKQYNSLPAVDLDIARADFFARSEPVPVDRPRGTARFVGSFDLASGRWKIHGIPGVRAHFAPPHRRASAELQIDTATGEWRIRPLPFDAPPLR